MEPNQSIRVLFAVHDVEGDAKFSSAIESLPSHIQPTIVHTGGEARSILETQSASVDVLVAAYELSDFSGVDLFALTKAQDIPIPVIVSIDCNPDHMQDIIAHGIEYYILKDPDRRCFDLLPILIPHVLQKYQERIEKEEEAEELSHPLKP